MNPVRRISPCSDAEAARAVSRETLADLAERITCIPASHAAPARHPARRWLLAGIPVTAGAAALLAVIVSGGAPPAAGPGPATAQAAVGRCWTGGGGNVCPVGVRVPVGYRGTATLVFGRAARPGEQYESAGSVTAPGEAMHGLHFRGRTVAAVLAMLRARHVTVPQYRYLTAAGSQEPAKVPGTWYVYDGIPWAPGQVLLVVGPTPVPQPVGEPSPVTPAPSPTAGR